MASVTISAEDSDFKALESAFLAVERAADNAADLALADAVGQLRRIVRLILIRVRADQERRAKRVGAQAAPLNWTSRTYDRDRKFLRQAHRR